MRYATVRSFICAIVHVDANAAMRLPVSDEEVAVRVANVDPRNTSVNKVPQACLTNLTSHHGSLHGKRGAAADQISAHAPTKESLCDREGRHVENEKCFHAQNSDRRGPVRPRSRQVLNWRRCLLTVLLQICYGTKLESGALVCTPCGRTRIRWSPH